MSFLFPLEAYSQYSIIKHFYCIQICDKLSSDLAVLTYIYFNVDDC